LHTLLSVIWPLDLAHVSRFIVIEKDDGKLQRCHANHLRKYNERVNEATVHNCAIIFDTDQDFGHVPT